MTYAYFDVPFKTTSCSPLPFVAKRNSLDIPARLTLDKHQGLVLWKIPLLGNGTFGYTIIKLYIHYNYK